MRWRDRIEANLSGRRQYGARDGDVRRDIADELDDHLHCATEDELHATPDLAAARRAAEDRFGDPDRVARALWLDAMKEMMVMQRISLATNVVLAIACIVLCFITFQTTRYAEARQQMLHAELAAANARMHESQQAEAVPAVWAKPVIEVMTGHPDGRRATGVTVELRGELYNPRQVETVIEITDADGRAAFGKVRPGIYRVMLTDENRLTHVRHVQFGRGATEPVAVIWPESLPEPVSASFTLEVPDGLDAEVEYVVASLQPIVDPASNDLVFWTRPEIDIVISRDNAVARLTDELRDQVGKGANERRRTVLVDMSPLSFSAAIEVEGAHAYEVVAIEVLVRPDPDSDDHMLIGVPVNRTREFEVTSGGPWTIRLDDSLRREIATRRRIIELMKQDGQ